MKRFVAIAFALALAGCETPKAEQVEPEPPDAAAPPPRATPRPRRDGASFILGDLGGAAASARIEREPVRDVLTAEATGFLDATWKDAMARWEARDWDGAAEQFSLFYDRSPRSRRAEEALFYLAECKKNGGDLAKALQIYEKLIKVYPSTDRYPTVLERVFTIGKQFAEGRAKKASVLAGIPMTDVEFGIDVLDKFAKQRDRHALAPEALYIIGDAQMRENEGELAIAVWNERLVKGYPDSPWARQAEYRIALAFLSLSAGIDYDKKPIMAGLKRLRAYIRKYPTGDKETEATQKLRELEEQLAQHDLGIAKVYARHSEYVAARIYLASIQREYPKTDAAREATQLARVWPNPPEPAAPPEKDESKK